MNGDTTGSAPRRILVVDDDEDVAAALRMLLRAEGYRVNVALTPDAALAAVRDTPPDVILADYRLGAAIDSGLDVVRSIRSVLERAPSAVVMSADTSGPVLEAIASVPGVEFLAKPFGAEELAAAIGRALWHAGERG